MSTELAAALAMLERGGVVAAATESMFGLLADATRSDAIDRLLGAKARGAEKGMPLLLPARAAWRALVTEIPPVAERLADAFWPGPLTIALPASPGLDPRLLLDGTVAVRLPGPSPAAELARAFGRPLTATSANLSGEPATADVAVVERSFARAIAAGELALVPIAAPGGSVSTVVVVRDGVLQIVRVGAISTLELERARG
jgi:L-threonylcarbamoyladenylate synthase